MKRLLFLIVALCAIIGLASATAFSAYAAYGDAWKATNDTYTVIMWNSTGTHYWLSTGNTTSLTEALIVAGGAGAASGGGGAGGLIHNATMPVSGNIAVVVGAKSAGTAYASTPAKGGDSSFNMVNATGGGNGAPGDSNGGNGGSGGGAGSHGSATTPGIGITGQGYAGGANAYYSSPYPSGGGGGAGGAGQPGQSNTQAGNGGDCLAYYIDRGIKTNYSGGGGGQPANADSGSGIGACLIGGSGNGATGTNAVANTGSGGGGGRTTGGNGSDGIVIIMYSTTVISSINASFTQSPNPSSVGNPVTFTDTSTGSPTTWNWTINGVITNTTQNAAYTFSSAGTYPINLNVTNSTGSFSDVTINQVVTNASGFTPQDLWMEGQFTKTLHITDSTNAPIPVVTVTDSTGQSYITTNGTAYFTESFGSTTFYFASTGYVSRSIAYFIDSDSEDTVQMATSSSSAPVYNVYPPKDVKFHITSFFGAPIPGASVTIQGITTSTGNWDWLVTLLGITLDEVAINGTAMTETTDSNGDAVFLMLPSVKYNITTTASGYTFPTSIIAPQATEYTLIANWNESWFSSGNDTLKDVNVSVSWVKFNDTYSFVNITYDDQTMTTTGGNITIYLDTTGRVANATAIKTMVITSSSCSNSTLVNTPTGGSSYRVLVNATTTDQNIVRTFTHYFKGSPVMLPGFTSETILWLALFIVIFTAAFAGAIHSPQMAIVLCVESWVFWAIGWLDALVTQFWYGETAIIGILTLASFIALLWNITEGKSKVKRSS